jgi:hypothetical protein
VASCLSAAPGTPAGGRPTGPRRPRDSDARCGPSSRARLKVRPDDSRAVSKATLDALQERRRASTRIWYRQVLWHTLVLGLGAGLFGYRLAKAPAMCVVAYLVVLSERLVPGPAPTSRVATHRLGRRLPAAGRHASRDRRRCRGHCMAQS